MTCPHCRSSATSQRRHRTELGYRRFRCRSCGRRFNERTGSGFNELHYPTDIVLLAVLWRLRYKLGFRDVAELLLERGYEVTHETIRGWETRFAPLLGERLRAKRRGHASRSWYIDETYVKVAGRWCYLYRAIDRDGQLIDSMLSEKRDKHAARRFLRRLVDVAEGRPLRVTTDHHPAYRRAIRWILAKTGAANRTEAVRIGRRLGVLEHRTSREPGWCSDCSHPVARGARHDSHGARRTLRPAARSSVGQRG